MRIRAALFVCVLPILMFMFPAPAAPRELKVVLGAHYGFSYPGIGDWDLDSGYGSVVPSQSVGLAVGERYAGWLFAGFQADYYLGFGNRESSRDFWLEIFGVGPQSYLYVINRKAFFGFVLGWKFLNVKLAYEYRYSSSYYNETYYRDETDHEYGTMGEVGVFGGYLIGNHVELFAAVTASLLAVGNLSPAEWEAPGLLSANIGFRFKLYRADDSLHRMIHPEEEEEEEEEE